MVAMGVLVEMVEMAVTVDPQTVMVVVETGAREVMEAREAMEVTVAP